MVSISNNTPSLSGLSDSQFDTISVGNVSIDEDNVSGVNSLQCRTLTVTDGTGNLSVVGNTFRFNGTAIPTFSGQGVYLGVQSGGIPSIFLCSNSNLNRLIAFCNGAGVTLATIQSWTSSAGDLRFTTNGTNERFRLYATQLAEFYVPVNLTTGNVFRINGVDVLTATALGTGITSSSLTSVGTLTGLTVGGNISQTSGTASLRALTVPSLTCSGTITGSDISCDTLSAATQLNGNTSWIFGGFGTDIQTSGGIYQGLTGLADWRIKMVTNNLFNSKPSLDFSDTLEPYRGRIEYDYSTDSINVYVGGSLTSSLSIAAGSFNIKSSLLISGSTLSDSSRNLTVNSLTSSGNITGVLATANQPNITSVGTLTSLNVSGSITGVLATANQPNITSVGTLTSLNVSGNITNGTNTFNTNVTSGNVGIGTTSPSAFLNVTTNRGNSPDTNGILVNSTVTNSTGHAYCTLRTTSTGGNPCLSFDVANVGGWSMFCDNADSEALKITSSWAMVGGNTFLNMRRDNNTINCGQVVFLLPRTIVSACARGTTGSWFATTALIGSYLQSSIVINYTLNSAVNGIRPSGYVAPVSGMYFMNFNARFADNSGLISFMPRLNGSNLLATDYWVPNDGSSRRCVSFNQMVQMTVGDAYEIVSTNGSNILWGEFSARLISTYGI